MMQTNSNPDAEEVTAEERFIAAAVAPLGENAEMQVMAERELRAMLEGAEPEIPPASLEAAAGNLEDGRSRRRGFLALYSLTLVASVAMLVPVWRDYQRVEVARWHVFSIGDVVGALPAMPFANRSPSKLPEIFGELSAEKSILLFGDPSTRHEKDRFKALADLEPRSAAFYADYSQRHCTRSNLLPEDYLATVKGLDPGNSWFRYLAAGVAAKKGVGERARPKRGSGSAMAAPFQIWKPSALDEAIQLLEEGARLPDYNPYRRELLTKRLAIFPPGDDVLGRKLARDYLFDLLVEGLQIHHEIAQAVSVRGYELARAGDRERFLRLVNAWESFCRRSLEMKPTTWMEPAFAGRAMSVAAEHLEAAARDLGEHGMESRYARVRRAFEQRKAAAKTKWTREWDRSRGGIERWQFISRFNQVDNPPPIPDDDLIAASKAEHAVLARLLAVAAWLIFLVAAIAAAAVRFRHGKQARRVSASLADVMTWKDHAWIAGAGVLIPYALFQVVEQFTPCGGRSYTLHLAGPSDYLRATSAMIVMTSAAFIVAGNRLGKRLGFPGWKRPMIPALIVGGFGVLAWIAGCVTGCTAYDIPFAVDEWPQAGLAITGVLACIAGIATTLVNRYAALRWLICCRTIIPAYVFAMLVMAASVPCQHGIERYWTNRNHMKIDPALPAIDPYDYEVAGLIQEEMLEIFYGEK
jgi:hypothetical protein